MEQKVKFVTMKDIKDYLHLYLRSGIRYFVFPDESITDGFLARYKRNYPTGEYAPLMDSFLDYERVLRDGYKPILRPLSDMTEEEATDIAIIMYGQPDSVKWRMEDKGSYFNVYRKYYSESFTIDKASGDIDRYSKEDGQQELQTTLQHHFITRYLLSKGFDLFGLIEAGLAIDKTTTSSPSTLTD